MGYITNKLGKFTVSLLGVNYTHLIVYCPKHSSILINYIHDSNSTISRHYSHLSNHVEFFLPKNVWFEVSIMCDNYFITTENYTTEDKMEIRI